MASAFPSATTVSGRYWHTLEDGRIQCDLCPRYCRLGEGQRGMCFVRAREGDEIEVHLRDFAEKSDPECLEKGRDLDDVRPGGLGTRFIRELMDVAEFVEPPDGEGNLLRMTKRIH